MTNRLGGHAVVIGGSIAGLTAARVLAHHFDQVTIFERDQITDAAVPHKSVPQADHVHVLLQGGQQVFTSLYPEFLDELGKGGAVRWRIGADAAFHFREGKAYNLTGSVREPRDLGFTAHSQSRELLEFVLRRSTIATSNVNLIGSTRVETLLYSDHHVRGVRIHDTAGAKSVEADLVIDAGGRGSRAKRWLSEMGFAAPDETTVGVDFAYSSTRFVKPSDYREEPVVMVAGRPPKDLSGGLLLAIENNTWHLSLAGRFGQYPPTDEAGFMAFAKSLPSRRIYDLIEGAERCGEITQHRFPASVQRHYERMPSFPEGFLVIGDAVCSFNPVYGQGMTSAALQVQALRSSLHSHASLDGIAADFFPKAAEVVSAPWILAANLDFAYPQTRGDRPPVAPEGARYFAALDALQVEDMEVQRLLLEVFQLMKPLAALWSDPIRERVLARLAKN